MHFPAVRQFCVNPFAVEDDVLPTDMPGVVHGKGRPRLPRRGGDLAVTGCLPRRLLGFEVPHREAAEAREIPVLGEQFSHPGPMLGQLLAMCVNQDVGVDGDQTRPSMVS